jgi:hypothetical protein
VQLQGEEQQCRHEAQEDMQMALINIECINCQLKQQQY